MSETAKENKIDYLMQPINPWARFWARALDLLLFAMVAGVVFAFFIPSLLEKADWLLGMLIIFLWIFAETIFLTTWGTTPGKWLLNLKITRNNSVKPSIKDFFLRSFAVWYKGLGMGIPLFQIITALLSYKYLKEFRATFWDIDGHFTVTKQKMGVGRIIFTVLVSCFVIGIAILGYIDPELNN